jgi:hypothetical protein
MGARAIIFLMQLGYRYAGLGVNRVYHGVVSPARNGCLRACS